MGFAELILTSIGLAMDAFAVSICKGLGMRTLNMHHAAVIAAFFGGFQALMPIVGWVAGSQFASIVAPVGHWIAFGLLAFVGGKMIVDVLREGGHEDGHEDERGVDGAVREDARGNALKAGEGGRGSAEAKGSFEAPETAALDLRELLMLAIATSIDALAVGVSLALLNVDIVGAATCIGVVTFALSAVGVAIGCQFGSRWEKPSTLAGGFVLIAIGIKTLIEHLAL